MFYFIRFWGDYFFLKSCFQKEIKKIIVLSPKKHQGNDHFEAFQENVNSNGYIKRAFKFVKWDRSYSLALICLKMKPKSPHNLRNRTACIQSRNSVTVFLFSYHAACLYNMLRKCIKILSSKIKIVPIKFKTVWWIFVPNSYNKIKQFYQNSFTMQSKISFYISSTNLLLYLHLPLFTPKLFKIVKTPTCWY